MEDSRLRGKPGRWNPMAGEWDACRSARPGSGGQRIENRVGEGAEIAGEHCRCRTGSADHVPLAFALPFVIEEEERSVPSVVDPWKKHRPAQRCAELIAFQKVAAGSEKVARVKFVVPEELVQRPANVVASRLRGGVEEAPRSAVFGRVGVLLHAEL